MLPQPPGARPDPRTPLGAVSSLLDAVVAADAEAIVDCYARREDLLVFVEGPRWQTVGHDAVARGWRDFCAAGPRTRAVTFTDGPHLHTGAGPAGAAGLCSVSGTVEMSFAPGDGKPGGRPDTLRLRLTWVLARDPDRWRVVHEHGSQPLADPYGTGDWLREPDPR